MTRRLPGWLVLSLVPALWGCATTARLDPLPPAAPAVFEAAPASTPTFSVGVAGEAKERAGQTGAVVGAVAGAVVGASLCGSYFYLCSPLLALVGAPIGATLALGLGNTETLTPELTLQLKRAIELAGPASQPQERVVAGANSVQRWPSSVGSAPVTRIVVRIDDVSLNAITQQVSQVAVRLRVELNRQGRPPGWSGDVKEFVFYGPSTDVAPWLDTPGQALATSLAEAYRIAGEGLVAELSGAPVAVGAPEPPGPARAPE